MKLVHKFTVSTKKEKRSKKERNGCGYSFNSFCPTSGAHPIMQLLEIEQKMELTV